MTPSREAEFHALLSLAQAGDQAAYRAFLNAVSDLARRFVARKIGAHNDVDDVVQEILISIHKALRTYDPVRPCMPWLAAIMHYRLSDWLRSHYAAAGQKTIPIEDVADFLISDVTAEPFAHEHIHKAVETLSESQQAVINAMYQKDLSVKETSQKLGLSVSAVKVTAHRAYRKLRQKLDER